MLYPTTPVSSLAVPHDRSTLLFSTSEMEMPGGGVGLFMSAVFVGYALFLDGPSRWLLLVLGFIYQLFMVSSFLSFAATNEFKITYLGVGPTEIRLAFILLNTAFIFFGVRGFETLTPWFICLFIIALCVVVFRAHKTIWAIDMAEKPRARSSR